MNVGKILPVHTSRHVGEIWLVEEGLEQLAAYERTPIGFEVRSRVDLDVLRASRGRIITEVPALPRWKDYDAFASERPTALPSRFDMSNWLVLSAFDDGRRLGGMIVAYDTDGCEMLEGRRDMVIPFDVRVEPSARGRGVGHALSEHVVLWARGKGCIELRVETQDVNVGACRFYRGMGCELLSAQERAYGPDIDEAMLIWRLRL